MTTKLLRNRQGLVTNLNDDAQSILMADLNPFLGQLQAKRGTHSRYRFSLLHGQKDRLSGRSAHKGSRNMAVNQMLCHGLDSIQINRQILVHRRVHSTAQTFKHEGAGISGIFVVELGWKFRRFPTLLALENSVFIESNRNDLQKTTACEIRGFSPFLLPSQIHPLFLPSIHPPAEPYPTNKERLKKFIHKR